MQARAQVFLQECHSAGLDHLGHCEPLSCRHTQAVRPDWAWREEMPGWSRGLDQMTPSSWLCSTLQNCTSQNIEDASGGLSRCVVLSYKTLILEEQMTPLWAGKPISLVDTQLLIHTLPKERNTTTPPERCRWWGWYPSTHRWTGRLRLCLPKSSQLSFGASRGCFMQHRKTPHP